MNSSNRARVAMHSEKPIRPSDLVMTQAETPPGIDVPDPDMARMSTRERTNAGTPPAELLREIKQLSDRVGGLDRLRELIEMLAAMGH